MTVRFNWYGQPRYTARQMRTVDRSLRSRPCKVCRAKRGQPCKGMKDGNVHMGRVPDGWDGPTVVEQAERRRRLALRRTAGVRSGDAAGLRKLRRGRSRPGLRRRRRRGRETLRHG